MAKVDRDPIENKPQIVRNLLKRFNNTTKFKRHSENSRKWFRQQATKLGKVRIGSMMRDRSRMKNLPKFGKLYLFQYDAKHKETLPYWDQFPLVFFFDFFSNKGNAYALGLNLHYLPPALRMVAFAALLGFKNDKGRYRKSTRLGGNFKYQTLKAMAESRLFEPCIKMYLLKNVRSKFIEIPADEWEIVMTLNISRFKHKDSAISQASVWSDSKNR